MCCSLPSMEPMPPSLLRLLESRVLRPGSFLIGCDNACQVWLTGTPGSLANWTAGGMSVQCADGGVIILSGGPHLVKIEMMRCERPETCPFKAVLLDS